MVNLSSNLRFLCCSQENSDFFFFLGRSQWIATYFVKNKSELSLGLLPKSHHVPSAHHITLVFISLVSSEGQSEELPLFCGLFGTMDFLLGIPREAWTVYIFDQCLLIVFPGYSLLFYSSHMKNAKWQLLQKQMSQGLQPSQSSFLSSVGLKQS